MPFGDRRGPLWANNDTQGKGFGRGLGFGCRIGFGKGLGLGYRAGYAMDSKQGKEYLEDEKHYLQERLKQIDSLLNR